jgi:siroheme synthase
LAPVPVVPTGTLPLLEAQLGEALKIMRDFATWVNSPRAPIEKCIAVADSVGQLARASAQLGKVAVRLQNGDPESRHRVIVEYAEPQGGGVRQTRKRLNHGRG